MPCVRRVSKNYHDGHVSLDVGGRPGLISNALVWPVKVGPSVVKRLERIREEYVESITLTKFVGEQGVLRFGKIPT